MGGGLLERNPCNKIMCSMLGSLLAQTLNPMRAPICGKYHVKKAQASTVWGLGFSYYSSLQIQRVLGILVIVLLV